MTVATFLATNFTIQEPTLYKSLIDGDIAVASRIVDNFSPHESGTPAMTVSLNGGHIFNGSSLTEAAPQTTGTITAPVTNPRFDRIVIDNLTGVISVVTGTENASPTPPVIPGGKTPIARVLLQTTTTAITNSMISDERDFAGSANRFKILTGTYDTSLTSNFSLTGLGFRPIGVDISVGIDSSKSWSKGSFDGATSVLEVASNANVTSETIRIGFTVCGSIITTGGTANLTGVSLDADGITLGRAKSGSPTGTASIIAKCYR